MQSLKVKVPGKLMLAGEYAVLEAGSPALVLAVDRYLEVGLQSADAYTLASDLLPEAFAYTIAAAAEQTVTVQGLETSPPELRFAAVALEYGWLAWGADLKSLPPFALQIRSALHGAAAKLGLGSSAAVCVGVLAALLAARGEDLQDAAVRLRLFKLALLAHRTVQGSGSGADIAGCISGSVTAYTPTDNDRLRLNLPLPQLLSTPWQMLEISRLPWPADWSPLHFGWTGTPASTRELIGDYQALKQERPELYGEFLFESSLTCLGLREALTTGNLPAFVAGLGRARRLLQRLDAELHAAPYEPPRIETPALKALADSAEALGGAGKLSGAGGGDCGLAWVPAAKANELAPAWRQAGIEPLTLKLDTEGVRLA